MPINEIPSRNSPPSGSSLPKPGIAFLENFTERVSSAVKSEGLAEKTLVVAVSGGPDSTALLLSLFSLRRKLGLTLHVAHLDHCLRTNSQDDQLFVARLAEELGLSYSTKKLNVRETASLHNTSIEEEGRDVRYKFLTDVVNETNADAMALGHTKDDQAETILLHLIRGSGLRGLGGMTISSSYSDPDGSSIKVFRPLLPFERGETKEFCKHSGVFPRTDETNSDQSNSRNYIRLHLLPKLGNLNPKVKAAILRISEIARRDLSYIDTNLDKVWNTLVDSDLDFLRINRPRLIEHHESIQFHLLQRAFSEVQCGKGSLSSIQLEIFVESVNSSFPKMFELPGGIYVKLDDKFVTLTRNPLMFVSPGIASLHLLNQEGETFVPYASQDHGNVQKIQGWTFESRILNDMESIEPNPFVAYLDYEKLSPPIVIRSRRPGDLFSPLGVKKEGPNKTKSAKSNGKTHTKNHRGKKLQSYLINAKVPVDIRDSIPLVIAGDKVVWVVGWRIAHGARITQQTKKVLQIKGYPILTGLGKLEKQDHPSL